MIVLTCSQKNKLKFRIKYFAGQTVIDIVHIIISSNLSFIILQSWALSMPTSHVFQYHSHLFSFVFRSCRCKVAKVWIHGLSLSRSRASCCFKLLLNFRVEKQNNRKAIVNQYSLIFCSSATPLKCYGLFYFYRLFHSCTYFISDYKVSDWLFFEERFSFPTFHTVSKKGHLLSLYVSFPSPGNWVDDPQSSWWISLPLSSVFSLQPPNQSSQCPLYISQMCLI